MSTQQRPLCAHKPWRRCLRLKFLTCCVRDETGLLEKRKQCQSPARTLEMATPEPRAKIKEDGPDAIWGHYNNYRSRGPAGSVFLHVIFLAVIFERHI